MDALEVSMSDLALHTLQWHFQQCVRCFCSDLEGNTHAVLSIDTYRIQVLPPCGGDIIL